MKNPPSEFVYIDSKSPSAERFHIDKREMEYTEFLSTLFPNDVLGATVAEVSNLPHLRRIPRKLNHAFRFKKRNAQHVDRSHPNLYREMCEIIDALAEKAIVILI
jgi:hypothetical protein